MDVFGKAFQDYMTGKKDLEITVYTDISGPEKLPVSYFFRSWDDMPEGEKLVIERSGGRVLDVGAGAGSHALELQKRGLQVLALDVSPGAVETMRQRGVKETHCGDFYDLNKDHFDTILFLMNGAGLAGDLKGLKKLLNHAEELLSAGGLIYIESTDIMYMYEDEDGSYRIPMGEKYYGELEYRLICQDLETKPFPWLFVDPDSLEYTARMCGLKTRIIYTGDNYNYVAELSKTK